MFFFKKKKISSTCFDIEHFCSCGFWGTQSKWKAPSTSRRGGSSSATTRRRWTSSSSCGSLPLVPSESPKRRSALRTRHTLIHTHNAASVVPRRMTWPGCRLLCFLSHRSSGTRCSVSSTCWLTTCASTAPTLLLQSTP